MIKNRSKKGGTNEKHKKQRNTLIALMITIIVLLILAGVSIAILTGEGGILSKAKTSRNFTRRTRSKRKIGISITGFDD